MTASKELSRIEILCGILNIRNVNLAKDIIDIAAKFVKEKRTFTGHSIFEQIEKLGLYPTTASVACVVMLLEYLFDNHDSLFDGYTAYWVHRPEGPIVYFPIPQEVIAVQEHWLQALQR